jgi:tetratricopeptide (TPR) repeat protein
LEEGSSPVPLTGKVVDLGHPRILQANRYAVNRDYDKAIKAWNYVVFEPIAFEESERFAFTNAVFTQLREAKLPRETMQALLRLYGKSYSLEDIDPVLIALLEPRGFQLYGPIIKYHARSSRSQDGQNLAAAHHNLGAVYRLQQRYELAAYHFAQANAYQPSEKYAQAWTDMQHAQGNYNPLDTMMEQTIEAAGKRLPPEDALVQPRMAALDAPENPPAEPVPSSLQPVELPFLFDETDSARSPVESVEPN